MSSDRYISQNALIKEIAKIRGNLSTKNVGQAIWDTPTADVEEVRHGEWEYRQLDEYKYYEVSCSCCGAKYWGNYDAYNEPDEFYYCPNCGADMRGINNAKE